MVGEEHRRKWVRRAVESRNSTEEAARPFCEARRGGAGQGGAGRDGALLLRW